MDRLSRAQISAFGRHRTGTVLKEAPIIDVRRADSIRDANTLVDRSRHAIPTRWSNRQATDQPIALYNPKADSSLMMYEQNGDMRMLQKMRADGQSKIVTLGDDLLPNTAPEVSLDPNAMTTACKYNKTPYFPYLPPSASNKRPDLKPTLIDERILQHTTDREWGYESDKEQAALNLLKSPRRWQREDAVDSQMRRLQHMGEPIDRWNENKNAYVDRPSVPVEYILDGMERRLNEAKTYNALDDARTINHINRTALSSVYSLSNSGTIPQLNHKQSGNAGFAQNRYHNDIDWTYKEPEVKEGFVSNVIDSFKKLFNRDKATVDEKRGLVSDDQMVPALEVNGQFTSYDRPTTDPYSERAIQDTFEEQQPVINQTNPFEQYRAVREPYIQREEREPVGVVDTITNTVLKLFGRTKTEPLYETRMQQESFDAPTPEVNARFDTMHRERVPVTFSDRKQEDSFTPDMPYLTASSFVSPVSRVMCFESSGQLYLIQKMDPNRIFGSDARPVGKDLIVTVLPKQYTDRIRDHIHPSEGRQMKELTSKDFISLMEMVSKSPKTMKRVSPESIKSKLLSDKIDRRMLDAFEGERTFIGEDALPAYQHKIRHLGDVSKGKPVQERFDPVLASETREAAEIRSLKQGNERFAGKIDSSIVNDMEASYYASNVRRTGREQEMIIPSRAVGDGSRFRLH